TQLGRELLPQRHLLQRGRPGRALRGVGGARAVRERDPRGVPIASVGMDAVWPEIVDDARWAPSPHNTQPWLVRPLSTEAAELYAVRERLLPVEDPDGRFATAALGIFLEALEIAAARLGLTLET